MYSLKDALYIADALRHRIIVDWEDEEIVCRHNSELQRIEIGYYMYDKMLDNTVFKLLDFVEYS